MQIDCDKAVMVTLKHDDKLQDGAECGFQVLLWPFKIIFMPKCWFTSFISCLRFLYDIIQCALLYTTITGERRIRVINLSLPCTSMLSNLFRSADLDSQFACMLKQGRCPCFWIYVFTCIYIYIFVFHASEYILVWYIVYWCFLFLCSG